MRTIQRDMVILTVATLAACGLFLGKAFHMDDPLVLWTAQRIAAAPGDFYGFSVNWYGYTAPMAAVDQNPPGSAYLAAPFGILFGWGEPVMHGAVALLAVVLIWSLYLLARQLRVPGLLAAGLASASPGVFVSFSTVMTDLPMTALFVCGITLWLRGLDDRRPTANLAAAMLIGLATLCKYFAISAVPLLLVYTLLGPRTRWARVLCLLLPVVMLAVSEAYTYKIYGTGHFFESFSYARAYHDRYALAVGRKVLTGLAFLGAGAAPVLFLAPWLWQGGLRIAAAVVALGIAFLVGILAASGWQVGETPLQYPWWFWLQYAVWLIAGLHVIALLITECIERWDRDSALLFLWIIGTLVFGMFLYHFVNIRVLLPALPAVALLGARRAAASDVTPRAQYAAVAAGLALSLCVAYADLRLANAGREAAARIAAESRAGRTWFSGHWGFQYYMEARGALPIDREHPDLRPGDTVVTPENASNRIEINLRGKGTDAGFSIDVCPWLTTMRTDCGAGFYADIWGPLPFVFGPVPPEKYALTVLPQ